MRSVDQGISTPPFDGPVDLSVVLAREAAALGRNEQSPPLTALCISGGGIRSATFGLGVIQGLASRKLLSQLDYLSTVSGGGFVGGWLTAWIGRKGPLEAVEASLVSSPSPSGNKKDNPVTHLRQYNHYLVPSTGALSPDVWTMFAGVFRNIVLN